LFIIIRIEKQCTRPLRENIALVSLTNAYNFSGLVMLSIIYA